MIHIGSDVRWETFFSIPRFSCWQKFLFPRVVTQKVLPQLMFDPENPYSFTRKCMVKPGKRRRPHFRALKSLPSHLHPPFRGNFWWRVQIFQSSQGVIHLYELFFLFPLFYITGIRTRLIIQTWGTTHSSFGTLIGEWLCKSPRLIGTFPIPTVIPTAWPRHPYHLLTLKNSL